MRFKHATAAGGKNSWKCTLVVTSAHEFSRELENACLNALGRGYFAVLRLYPTYEENWPHLVEILNLQNKNKYEMDEDLNTLRYRKLLMMSGSEQLKAAVIKFFYENWPSLLKQFFLLECLPPMIKASKGKNISYFFSPAEVEEWQSQTYDWPTYCFHHFKDFGTLSTKDAKAIFSKYRKMVHMSIRYGGNEDDTQTCNMAFSKKTKYTKKRQEWLATWMKDRERRRLEGLSEINLYQRRTKEINCRDFINQRLVPNIILENERFIPSLIDGFTPGQRKVIFTCIKRNDQRAVTVAQLAGCVVDQSGYDNGEASLVSTIIALAQDFVGANNINLLLPLGQFGSRFQVSISESFEEFFSNVFF